MPRIRTKRPNALSILVAGANGCGKTSLVRRFVDNTFIEDYEPTRFMDTRQKKMEIDGQQVVVLVNDTDGDRNYENYSINYYHEMDATIIVYNISKQDSMEAVKDIYERIERYCRDPVTVLVGCVSDETRELDKESIESFAKDKNSLHFETSSKTGENVETMFMTLINKLWQSKLDKSKDKQTSDSELEPANKADNDTRKSAPVTSTDNSSCSCTIS